METAELVTYIVFAVIAASLIFFAVRSIDYKKNYEDASDLFKNADKNIYKVDAKDFPHELAKRWEDCRFGIDDKSSSVFVKDSAMINREFIVNGLQKDGKCNEIDCLNKSNSLIVNGSILTPKIINIKCFSNSLIIS